MHSALLKSILLAAIPILTSASASAHLSYANRNFGIYTGVTPQTVTISGQTVPSNYGWADGTDGDYGHSHQLRPFRFTLESTAQITISITDLGDGLLPGFSIYAGLGNTSPAADYDDTEVSQAYLASLGGGFEGSFNALGDFKMGNELGALSSFDFMGYAVDGTATNFGPAAGVIGDGLADGTVSGTFVLGPGDYTLFVGGANYAGQAPTPDTAVYGVSATISSQVIPEPTSATIVCAGLALLGARRHRRRSPV